MSVRRCLLYYDNAVSAAALVGGPDDRPLEVAGVSAVKLSIARPMERCEIVCESAVGRSRVVSGRN